ncbi:porphobilinogen synthase [Halobacteriovorax sp. JY17]|uniref:porphobilinogen synthase n=1 Tax=Halobacteriovorax sp. JY17 TaxID=2014617 RepID=UPI000C632CE3|nr:porphobilinogen synthase [Halobacteriovorax sp. JY17]PIK15535.1 MAG: delta-aminolevulinic acid dehydratase [Halobacteriovorax sp. JY17]
MMTYRPRRNRSSKSIRNLVRENILTTNDLIAPLFVIEGENSSIAIDSMPGQARLSVDLLVKEVVELWNLGIPCVSLFPALDDSKKDKYATESYNDNGLFQRAIRAVKEACPEILIMTDVAMDPYSSDGHDGVVADNGEILNDETLEILANMAISQARAGSDIIGPSDMMDGRVGYIRDALDDAGFTETLIMSYTAKYASAFYGPFRDALDSAPKSGDKKTYQMDYANKREAIRETILDEQEGADILMVKPGLSYLDIISDMRANTTLPIAAYNVSGEYAMVKAASERGWIDGEAVMMEMLMAFKRAGCDMILTYFAKEAALVLNR